MKMAGLDFVSENHPDFVGRWTAVYCCKCW